MAAELFDDLGEVYEAMIDWPRRLAAEEPFYRQLVAEVGARSVLDVACGTGRHAAMFHSWGLAVEGADISPQMIQRCLQQFGEEAGLRWVVRAFDQPMEAAAFDAATCVGNSLALAADVASVGCAIGQMLSAVRKGGVVVVQVLNLWHLADGPCLWQKCLRATLGEGDCLIHKGVHRSGGRGYVELIVTRINDSRPLMRSQSVPFLGLEAPELADMARKAGATDVKLLGDYQQQPYDRHQSQDLIMVARK